MGKIRFRLFVVVVIASALVVGCGSKAPKESMTAGHATIGASDAIADLAWHVSEDFQTANRGAFVDIVRNENVALVDSLLNERADEIFLDRQLTPAETLSFYKAKLKLHSYAVALYPVYLLVAKSNPVEVIDSAAFLGVLTGSITNWKEVGGQDAPITVYIQHPGEGAWNSVMDYYHHPDSVEAVACSTLTQMLSLAQGNDGALLVYPKPYEDLPYKKLMFQRIGMNIPANPKTIAEAPEYPFRLDITYVTTHYKGDVAAGYLTYMTSNIGQRGIMNRGYRPASVPVRVIQLKG